MINQTIYQSIMKQQINSIHPKYASPDCKGCCVGVRRLEDGYVCVEEETAAPKGDDDVFGGRNPTEEEDEEDEEEGGGG